MTLLEQDKATASLVGQPVATSEPEKPSQEVVSKRKQADEEISSSRLTKIARSISLIFHPFLVSPLAIVLILWLDQGRLASAIGWAGLCAAFVVAPGMIYLRRKLTQKEFTDADVSVQEHRYGFYLFGAACMIICFLVLIWLKAPTILIVSFTAALVSLVAAAIINRYWTKISIHTGTMAGVTVLAGYYSWPLAIALGLGVLAVSWARLVTKRHTLQQAILGWLIAGICVFGTVEVGFRLMG